MKNLFRILGVLAILMIAINVIHANPVKIQRENAGINIQTATELQGAAYTMQMTDQGIIPGRWYKINRIYYYVKNYKSYVVDPNWEDRTVNTAGMSWMEVQAKIAFYKKGLKEAWGQLGNIVEAKMAKMGAIKCVDNIANDVSSLTETALLIQKNLQFLAYYKLLDRLGLMGMNLYPGIQNKDILTVYERQAGIAKPYDVSITPVVTAAGRAKQSILDVEKAYANIKDNPNNYKKTIVGPDVMLGKNQSKMDPWQEVMLSTIVKTFGEDILFALFPGQRDITDLSPLGCFDGFDTKIDALIASGDISVGNGNLYNTDDIELPTDESDTDAFDILLDFFRSSHNLLRESDTILKVPVHISDAYDSAYFNKFRYKSIQDQWGRTILEGSNGRCKIVKCPEMGTGTRIILEVEKNSDFGMDTTSDAQFIQVRWVDQDPNIVQFWIQASFGTRIRTINKKSFRVNDGTPVALSLSGDYS